MRIGALAKCTGISVESIRHYEKLGLLSKANRSKSGQRLYETFHLNQLKIIRQLRSLDFSLKEIELLFKYQSNPDTHTKADVKTLVNVHIEKLDNLLSTISTTRNYLLTLRDACDGSEDSALDCPILEDLVIKHQTH